MTTMIDTHISTDMCFQFYWPFLHGSIHGAILNKLKMIYRKKDLFVWIRAFNVIGLFRDGVRPNLWSSDVKSVTRVLANVL